MENTIIVALKGIIVFNNKALIVQRSADDEIGASTWEFVGGKLDFGEDLEAALMREIEEEVDLNVTVGKLLYAATFKISEHRQLVILAYKCTAHDDFVRLSGEHQNYMWADKAQMMELLEKPIIEDLNRYSVLEYIFS